MSINDISKILKINRNILFLALDELVSKKEKFYDESNTIGTLQVYEDIYIFVPLNSVTESIQLPSRWMVPLKTSTKSTNFPKN